MRPYCFLLGYMRFKNETIVGSSTLLQWWKGVEHLHDGLGLNSVND